MYIPLESPVSVRGVKGVKSKGQSILISRRPKLNIQELTSSQFTTKTKC